MQPLISVVIPTYNRADRIHVAITSVLRQSYTNIELIIVDDGSTDSTSEIVRQFGDTVKYIFQENMGVSAARNVGIGLSKGRYISFLDSDDEWLPDKLTIQADVLNKYAEISLVLCDCIYVDPTGYEIGESVRRQQLPQNGDIFSDVLFSPYLIPSSILVRKQILDDVGSFDTSLKTAEDIDLFLRIAERGQVFLVEKPLIRYMRGNKGLGDSVSSYDDHLIVVLRCVENNKRRIPDAIRKKCLFNCYCSFTDGKIWQKEFLDATKGLYYSFRYVTGLFGLVKIIKMVLTLVVCFLKKQTKMF